MEKSTKKLGFGALISASLFCLAYVTFAHIANWQDSRQFFQGQILTQFKSAASLAKHFEIRSKAPLEYKVDSYLRLTGSTGLNEKELAELELQGPEFKLQESEINLRFRIGNNSSYDLNFGIVSSKRTNRNRLLATLRNQKEADLLIRGNPDATSMDTTNNLTPCSYATYNKDAPIFKEYGDWIDLTLRISPQRHRVILIRNGKLFGTCAMNWISGENVRLLLTLQGKLPDHPINLKIQKFSYTPLSELAPPQDIVEHFKDDIIDPTIWSVSSSIDSKSHQNYEIIEGGGLMLTGVNGDKASIPLMLDSILMELDSFDATFRIQPIEMNNCSLSFGWRTGPPGTPFYRSYLLTLRKNNGLIQFLPSAHVDGQEIKVPLGKWPAQIFEAHMNYDGKQRLATIGVNDVQEKMNVDFSPGEPVRFRIRSWCKAHGSFKLRVESIEIRHVR